MFILNIEKENSGFGCKVGDVSRDKISFSQSPVNNFKLSPNIIVSAKSNLYDLLQKRYL